MKIDILIEMAYRQMEADIGRVASTLREEL